MMGPTEKSPIESGSEEDLDIDSCVIHKMPPLPRRDPHAEA